MIKKMIKKFEKLQFLFYSSFFMMEPEPEPKLCNFSAPAPAKKATGSETLLKSIIQQGWGTSKSGVGEKGVALKLGEKRSS